MAQFLESASQPSKARHGLDEMSGSVFPTLCLAGEGLGLSSASPVTYRLDATSVPLCIALD
eukprot:1143766-Pleurochrysis_carterae.AAC.3